MVVGEVTHCLGDSSDVGWGLNGWGLNPPHWERQRESNDWGLSWSGREYYAQFWHVLGPKPNPVEAIRNVNFGEVRRPVVPGFQVTMDSTTRCKDRPNCIGSFGANGIVSLSTPEKL